MNYMSQGTKLDVHRDLIHILMSCINKCKPKDLKVVMFQPHVQEYLAIALKEHK